MDLLTRFTYHSEVCPGVSVVFRRPSRLARSRYLESIYDNRTRLRELYRQRKPLDDSLTAAREKAWTAAKVEVDRLIEAENITRQEAESRVQVRVDFPDDQLSDWAVLTDEINRLEKDEHGRATLRGVFVSIDGLTLGGVVPTADQLIDEADMDLTDELVAVALKISELSPTERGESPWPGISAQAAAGPKTDTIAPFAENESEQNSAPDSSIAS